VTINGTAVVSGAASGPIALAVGSNVINTVVTAQDGVTTKTYTLTVTRSAALKDAQLSSLILSSGTLSPAFAGATIAYTATVANSVSSITITPTTADVNATVTVDGVAATSGTASQSLPLAVGANTVTAVVTAQDGTTKKTYTITVTRAASSNASLSLLKTSRGTLTPVFKSTTTSYTANVVNGVTSTIITPTAADSTATITVNGTLVSSGAASPAIPLAVGTTAINTVVTAQDGVTKETYTLTVTRPAGTTDGFDPGISVTNPAETPSLSTGADVVVHQGVSPNGDGINDFLLIDNISQYPDNKLTIMNRNGQLIYETQGYDNSSKVFDGHSNKNGQMQLPGTYFYQLDYTVSGITRHKTGFIVLKY
jgi:gliding motility-associated-like protein